MSQPPIQSSQMVTITSGSQHPQGIWGVSHEPSLFFLRSITSGGKVMFEAAARNAWHTHPFGPILIVLGSTGSEREDRVNLIPWG